MKRWWKIAIPLAAAVAGAIILWSVPNRALANLERTRQSLRQAGFKVDLQEFDFSIPPDIQRRSALLGRSSRAELTNRASAALTPGPNGDLPELLSTTGDGTAVPAWKRSRLRNYQAGDFWPRLAATLRGGEQVLAAKREAAASGPVRFEPIGWPTLQPLVPYLADLKRLQGILGAQSSQALWEGDRATAWTNLVAITCIATAYVPEPLAISLMVRNDYVATAFDATWSVLQAGGWSDAQLASLQRRWEDLNVWTNLVEGAAYDGAAGAAMCQAERANHSKLGVSFGWMVRHPREAITDLSANWQRMRYLHRGSYEDEAALLLFYRDREVEIRSALLAATWSEMCPLAGVTNPLRFTSTNASTALCALNMQQLSLRVVSHGRTLIGGAAEAEARRRVVITALALERFRARNSRYPETLAALVPDFLKSPPVDFMDGQPLRYRLDTDGQFLLYSVGLDCVDNEGKMPLPQRWPVEPGLGASQNTDLVWPRPASPAETAQFEAAETLSPNSRFNNGH